MTEVHEYKTVNGLNRTNLRKAVKYVEDEGWTIGDGAKFNRGEKRVCPYVAFLAWTGLIDIHDISSTEEGSWHVAISPEEAEDINKKLYELNPGLSMGAFVCGVDGISEDEVDLAGLNDKYYKLGQEIRSDMTSKELSI